MSRLYYPPQQQPKLAAGEEETESVADKAKKVAKLIPAEVITGYTTLINLTQGVRYAALRPWLFGFSFLLGLVATPLYLKKMAEAGKPNRNFIITSTVGFVFWAYFTSGRQVMPDWYDTGLASIALVVFSILSGLVRMNH